MQGRELQRLAVALLLTPLASSQSAAPQPDTSPLAFDVVSIKENPGPNYTFMGVASQPGGIDAISAMTGLIAEAYGMRPEFVICRLPLCDKPIFELRAKLDQADVPRFTQMRYPEQHQLLVPVLADRFGLKTHTELRPINVYELVGAKGGAKLKPPPADHAIRKDGDRLEGGMYLSDGHVRGFGIPVDALVNILSSFVSGELSRPILNKTGLPGIYDIDLKWSNAAQNASAATNPTGTDPADPDLFTAVREQLGLELKPARESIPTLIVDQLHVPTPD